jgi:hypothetical protein
MNLHPETTGFPPNALAPSQYRQLPKLIRHANRNEGVTRSVLYMRQKLKFM